MIQEVVCKNSGKSLEGVNKSRINSISISRIVSAGLSTSEVQGQFEIFRSSFSHIDIRFPHHLAAMHINFSEGITLNNE